MNNFDNWKAGLTVESFNIGEDDNGLKCDFCPAYEDCMVAVNRRESGDCRDKFKRWAESEYIPPKAEKTKVEQLADLLGVVVGVPFNVRDTESGELLRNNPHMLTQHGLFVDCDFTVCNRTFSDVLTGDAWIEKIPQQPEEWKPKSGSQYWFVNTTAEIYQETWLHHNVNYARYAFGNCFPTEEAAEAGKADVMAKFEAIKAEIGE